MPQIHEITGGQSSLSDRDAMLSWQLRPGMWVRWQEQTGIFVSIDSESVCQVMLVDGMGLNKLAVLCHASALTQAFYGDIPEPRKEGRDDAIFRKLGYVHKV